MTAPMARLPTVRRGMTLVELLVVVAILMLLIITVAPNLVNTADARRGREAARMLSSFIAKAQSRAIGRPNPAGLMLVASSTASFAALDVFLADVPPPYRGDTADATITMSGSGSTQRTGSASAGAFDSILTVSATSFDLIRFGGRGPMFELVTAPTTTGSMSIRMLGFEDFSRSPDDLGYTSRNTPWPPAVPLPFEIFRRPEPVGSPLSLPDGRAVDLFWSGVGPPLVGGIDTYRLFSSGSAVFSSGVVPSGVATTALFDGTGRLRQVVCQSGTATQRIAVTGPVFLLVGRPERAGQAAVASLNSADETIGANWQYPDSWWVAIDPMTGVANSAECVPGAATVTDSQAFIRAALLGTGR